LNSIIRPAPAPSKPAPARWGSANLNAGSDEQQGQRRAFQPANRPQNAQEQEQEHQQGRSGNARQSAYKEVTRSEGTGREAPRLGKQNRSGSTAPERRAQKNETNRPAAKLQVTNVQVQEGQRCAIQVRAVRRQRPAAHAAPGKATMNAARVANYRRKARNAYRTPPSCRRKQVREIAGLL